MDVHADVDEEVLRARVRDDGRGDADPAGGSGLVRFIDRVEELGGRVPLQSPPGAGTALQVVLPLTEQRGPARGS